MVITQFFFNGRIDPYYNFIKYLKVQNYFKSYTIICEEEISKDFNHNPHSSIFDLTQTQVIKGKFSRVLSWYDNEWGFSNRMCDTAIQIAGLI